MVITNCPLRLRIVMLISMYRIAMLILFLISPFSSCPENVIDKRYRKGNRLGPYTHDSWKETDEEVEDWADKFFC